MPLHYTTVELIHQVTMSTPAVPIWCLHAWTWKDETGVIHVESEVSPVVALRTTVGTTYSQKGEHFDGYVTHDALLEAGFRVTDPCAVNTVALVVTDLYGEADVTSVDEIRRDGQTVALVMEYGPKELADLRAEALTDTEQAEERRRKREAAQKAATT